MIGSFLVGAIVGGAAVWLYGNEIRTYLDDKTRVTRTRVADTLHAAAEGLETAKDKLESGLSGQTQTRSSGL